MICHGCASRCMISDSANGSNCGVCNEGTLSAEPTEAIWDSENTRIWPGIRLPSVSSVSRARSTPATDNKSSTTLGGPIRESARCLSSPATGAAILMIASAAACWNLRIAPSRPALLPLCLISASAVSNARAASGAPSRPSHCQIGSSDARRICPALTGKLLSTRKGSSGPYNRRAGSSVRGRASSSSSVPRTTLRSCSSTKLATAMSSPRSMARSNSRISSACD